MTAVRTFVTRMDRNYVGQCITDGEFFWLVNADGVQVSEACVNVAQIIIRANRMFGALINWDPIKYGC